jgi:hypothetical protein
MKQAAIALFVAAASMLGQTAHADAAASAVPTSSGNFYTGDAKVVVVDRYAGSATLAKPGEVRVDDFKVLPGAISIDDSLAARLHRHHQLRKGQDVDSTPDILAQHVQAAFSEALVAELDKANIPVAKRAGVGVGVGDGDGDGGDATAPDLIVAGEFVAMDEGSETQRVMVGFGLGASDVKAHVTVSTMSQEGSVVLLAFDMTAESNKKPGAAITSSTSLATGAAKKAFGDRKSKVENDAARMGTLAARQIEGVMSDRKWTDAAAPVTRVAENGPAVSVTK